MYNRKISALIIIISLLFSLNLTTSEAATKNRKKKSKASSDVTVQTEETKKSNETDNTAKRLDRILAEWSHEDEFNSPNEQSLHVKVTYYSNEYVEALVQSEAEKNLWTNSEMENYKYTLLKNLNLAESIPFHLSMYVRGTPMYPAPFDKHIKMRVGKNVYEPIDFDRRFNFKILGGRDGIIYFPRYDPKTGKEILDGARDVRITLDSAISHALTSRGDVTWVWDLTRDRGKISGGTAANRLEVDRLIKRSDKLKEERDALQRQIDAINKEFDDVNSRIDELQEQ